MPSHYDTIVAYIKAGRHVRTREEDVIIRYFTSIILTIKAQRESIPHLIMQQRWPWWTSITLPPNKHGASCFPVANAFFFMVALRLGLLSQIVFQSCLDGWGQTGIQEAFACLEINRCIILKGFFVVCVRSICVLRNLIQGKNELQAVIRGSTTNIQ